MTSAMRDYFTYLPRPSGTPVWGVAVTGAGFARIPPGGAYPPKEFLHPSDHMFTWDKGRVLDIWQMILIHHGTGWFESRPTGRRRCRAGTVFILFPGVWHRYKPDPKTGWTDSYIEFSGPVSEQLRAQGALQPKRAVFQLGEQPELTELFERIHVLAQNRPVGHTALLATSTLQILSLILSLSQTAAGAPQRVHDIVHRAQTLLMERCDEPIQVHRLARELGIGYSYFRRTFRQHTGLSPKKYAAQLRLRRVQSLLRTTPLTIKEIAEQMGYHSPYHLSAEFKKQTGLSPIRWRHRRYG
jgi:AraC-like DNA-binding protein